jgi:hypothetical protein
MHQNKSSGFNDLIASMLYREKSGRASEKGIPGGGN